MQKLQIPSTLNQPSRDRRNTMAKLIQLRQRIKAIETIKKITHAMRLISMSTHSHLKALQDPLLLYTDALNQIFDELLSAAPGWRNPLIHAPESPYHKILFIIVGSQKGLCGSFNTHLFKVIHHHLQTAGYAADRLAIIAIGQKAIDFTRSLGSYRLQHAYEKFNAQNIESIAQEITRTIISAKEPYQSVLIASNLFKSFFAQKPQITQLTPFKPYQAKESDRTDDITWEQSPAELLDALIPQYFTSQIHYFLFQSLLAEHAARFISMDTATRNANSLLETSRLEYNKLRQAKITKELTELIGSFN